MQMTYSCTCSHKHAQCSKHFLWQSLMYLSSINRRLLLTFHPMPYHKGDPAWAPGPWRLVSVCLAFDANLRARGSLFFVPSSEQTVEYERIPYSLGELLQRVWGLNTFTAGDFLLLNWSLLSSSVRVVVNYLAIKGSEVLYFFIWAEFTFSTVSEVLLCRPVQLLCLNGFVSCLLSLIIDRSLEEAGTGSTLA